MSLVECLRISDEFKSILARDLADKQSIDWPFLDKTYIEKVLGIIDTKAEETLLELRWKADDEIEENPFIIAYLQEICRIPKLTAGEEIELAKRIERGDKSAENRMVEAHLRVVARVARHYVGRGLSYFDLIQEGNLCLLNKVKKFDYRTGHRFGTMAIRWVYSAIAKEIDDQVRIVRIPGYMCDVINKLNRISSQLHQRLSREPHVKEIAKEMDLSVERVREIMEMAQDSISLDTSIVNDDCHLVDFVQDDDTLSTEEAVSSTFLRLQLEEALGRLGKREENVIRLHFGLDDGHCRSFEEIGQIYNVSRESIRQIERKGFHRLRCFWRNSNLKDYLY